MRTGLKATLLSILWTAVVWGQATTGFHRVDRAIARAYGSSTAQVMPYATVRVTNTATGAVALIYSDPLLSHQIVSGTVTADANGNYDYYVALNYCVNEAVSAPGQGSYSTTNICQNGGTETVIQANGTPSDPLNPVDFVNSPTVNFSVSGNQISASLASGAGMNIQHNSSAGGILQTLLNFCDNGSCGASVPSGQQQVTFGPDASGGWSAWTANATAQLTAFSQAPLSGQHVIVNPTSYTVSYCGTSNNAFGDDKSGNVVMVGSGSCGNSSVTWTFNTSSLPAGVSIDNVTAVYPFVISASSIQNQNGSGNDFDTDCTGTGVNLHNNRTDLGFNTNPTYPSQQYTSSTSLTVSEANFNAMTCSITASMVDSGVGGTRVISGNATLVGAYVYYTGTPVTQPSQIYVQSPLRYDSSTSTLSLPLPYDGAVDFGTADNYVVENSNFTSFTAPIHMAFCAQHASTSAAPQLDLNGWGNATIVGPTGGTLSPGDIANCVTTGVETWVYLGGNGDWFLQNPQVSGGGSSVSITSSLGSLTFTPSPLTGTGTADINYAHAGTWTALETFSAGISIPSGQGITQTTGGSASNCWNTAGTTTACSGGTGTPGGTTGQIQYNNSGSFGGANITVDQDQKNLLSSGNGACPIVGTGTQICITAAPYYASPYGATTTTGTFSASATSGTVGSCSTFSANNGVLIAGGASGGWNGTSYIGKVVSCSGTTLTITPAITNAVSGAVVQHDETAAITAAFTALNPLGGTIYFPNINTNSQGVYLVNGALQDTSGANAILPVPKIANNSGSNIYSNPMEVRIVGEKSYAAFSAPVIQTALNVSGDNLFGGYDSATGGGFPNFTNVQLDLDSLYIIGPSGGSETLVNGTWIEAVAASHVAVVTKTPFVATSGNGILFPTISNAIRNIADNLSVAGFQTCMRMGEHGIVTHSNATDCTNGLVLDAAPTGGSDIGFANGITVNNFWCGPAAFPSGSSTVTNCIVSGANATYVDANVNYEGTGTLVNDATNLLHGSIRYVLAGTACPTNATLSGGSNLVYTNLKCSSGGVSTATQGGTTVGHLVVIASDGHDVVDGGPVPSGGTGAWTNLTSTVVWTGCTAGTTTCVVGTPVTTVSISSVPTSYNTLVFVILGAACSTATANASAAFSVNSGTATSIVQSMSVGNGAVSGSSTTTSGGWVMPCASAVAGSAGTGSLTIPNYSGTTFLKYGSVDWSAGVDATLSAFYENRGSAGMVWNTMSAITQLSMASASGNFIAGSTFAVYGIR